MSARRSETGSYLGAKRHKNIEPFIEMWWVHVTSGQR